MKRLITSIQKISLYVAIPATFLAASCNSGNNNNINNDDSTTAAPADTASAQAIRDLQPKGPKPEWAPSITDNMLVVIDLDLLERLEPSESPQAFAAD